MQTILLSHEDVATIAKKLDENGIREIVEREGNIGKMVIIGVETGDYDVDKNGLHASTKWFYVKTSEKIKNRLLDFKLLRGEYLLLSSMWRR